MSASYVHCAVHSRMQKLYFDASDEKKIRELFYHIFVPVLIIPSLWATPAV